MLSGNKGEWTEMYVLFKLLAEGKLYAADAELKKNPDIFFPIIKILREEAENKKREYVLNGNVKVINGMTGKLIISVPTKEFLINSELLLKGIIKGAGRSFKIPDIENFASKIDCGKKSDSKTKKEDIKIIIHDLRTGIKPTLGFSIKSLLGKDSTLFNPGSGTNFIYKITGKEVNSLNVDKFNKNTLVYSNSNRKSKISHRLNELERLKLNLEFIKTDSDTLGLNLRLIDSDLPEILAFALYYKYKDGISRVTKIIQLLNKINPMNYDQSMNHPFYEYKIKNFLTDSALGMTAEKIWSGEYSATGGIIMVKKDGEVLCYHIYNRNEFQNYLLNHTRFDQPATSEDESNPGHEKKPTPGKKVKPYKYSWVYIENKQYYIKLNLQVRFL